MNEKFTFYCNPKHYCNRKCVVIREVNEKPSRCVESYCETAIADFRLEEYEKIENNTPNCSRCRWLYLRKTEIDYNGAYCSAIGYKACGEVYGKNDCVILYKEKIND